MKYGDAKRGRRFEQWFYEWTIGYGERPWRMFYWIGTVIVLFALIYFFTDCIKNRNDKNTKWDPITSLYFSAVTFATLGYGDYAPTKWWAKLLTIFEALLGLAMNALFVVALARIIIRD